MSQFTKIKVVNNIKHGQMSFSLVKYQKNGTKRAFFRPEFNGKAISRTMFARLYDADNQGRDYIRLKLSKHTS